MHIPQVWVDFFPRAILLINYFRCVRLGKFDTERTITFIPPDGEFELMRYRVTSVKEPFKLIPSVKEGSKTKLSLDLKVDSFITTLIYVN